MYTLLDTTTGENVTVENEQEYRSMLLVENNGDSWNPPDGADVMVVRAQLEGEGHVMRYNVVE